MTGNWYTLHFSGVPQSPQGPIQFCSVLENSVTLEWSAPRKDGGSGISGYRVELTSDRKVWKEMTFCDAQTTMLTATDLIPGHSYSFRIYAINGVG